VIDFFGVESGRERRNSGMAGNELPGQGKTNDWLTPRWILDALGPFDLDPCAFAGDPTRCAPIGLTWRENGLTHAWGRAFVWCNPPYGPHVGKWLQRMEAHQNGIALVFARTDTKAINPYLFLARATLFIEGRLVFETPDQRLAKGNAGAPSILLAFGAEAEERLRESKIPGVLMGPK
jgi:hypothetical protein